MSIVRLHACLSSPVSAHVPGVRSHISCDDLQECSRNDAQDASSVGGLRVCSTLLPAICVQQVLNAAWHWRNPARNTLREPSPGVSLLMMVMMTLC